MGKSRLGFAISVIVAGVLVAVSLRSVNIGEISAALRQTQPALIGLAALTLSGSYLARGVRWRIQVMAAAPISLLTAFWATMSSYLANNLLPLRAGEIIRPLVTSRVAGIRISYALAAVLVEHIVDIVALVIMSFAASIAQVTMPVWLHHGAVVFSLLGFGGITILLLTSRMEHWIGAALLRMPIPIALANRLREVLRQFTFGLRSLQSLHDIFGYLGTTIMVWLLDLATGIAVAWALRIPLSWPQMALLLVALSLTSALPSTPANIGVWQVVAVGILVPFGVMPASAFAYILVYQVVTYGVESFWGAIGLLIMTRTYPLLSADLLRKFPSM